MHPSVAYICFEITSQPASRWEDVLSIWIAEILQACKNSQQSEVPIVDLEGLNLFKRLTLAYCPCDTVSVAELKAFTMGRFRIVLAQIGVFIEQQEVLDHYLLPKQWPAEEAWKHVVAKEVRSLTKKGREELRDSLAAYMASN